MTLRIGRRRSLKVSPSHGRLGGRFLVIPILGDEMRRSSDALVNNRDILRKLPKRRRVRDDIGTINGDVTTRDAAQPDRGMCYYSLVSDVNIGREDVCTYLVTSQGEQCSYYTVSNAA